MRYYSNTAIRTTLENIGGISPSTTTLELQSVTGWPTQFPFTARLEPDSGNEEIVTVNSGGGTSGNPYIVTRGVDGTTAKPHSQYAIVTHGFSARDFKEPQDHIADTGKHFQGTFASEAARDAVITSPAVGMITYITNTGALMAYINGEWERINGPMIRRLTTSQTTFNTAYNNVPGFKIPLAANAIYLGEVHMYFASGASNGQTDMGIRWAFPSGAELAHGWVRPHPDSFGDTTASAERVHFTGAHVDTVSPSVESLMGGHLSAQYIPGSFTIDTASTPGNLQLQYKMINDGQSQGVTILRNSYIKMTRMA